MKEWIIHRVKNANVDNFTSDFGIKMRRKLHKCISFSYFAALTYYYKKNIIVDNRVKLDKNKNYIFASNHSFFFDGAAIAASIDRNCYCLGDFTAFIQDDFKRSIFALIAGLIYVNRFDKQSRNDSVEKINRILKAGTSILMFPEGKWNDSENKLCQKLFSGVYNISLMNEIEVVPISVFNEMGSNDIHVNYGAPLKLYDYERLEGLQILRDTFATMLYEQIEKYSTPFCREKIVGDIHIDYMEQRMKEYSEAKWKSDYCFDNDLFEYKAGDVDLEDVWKDVDIVKIDTKNANIFSNTLVDLEKRKKYSLRNYMNENYRKKY